MLYCIEYKHNSNLKNGNVKNVRPFYLQQYASGV